MKMKIAPRITLFGNCKEAAAFYQRVFPDLRATLEPYSQHSGQFAGMLRPEHEDLIYRAELVFPCEEGPFRLIMGDSPSVLFGGGGVIQYNPTLELVHSEQEWIQSAYEKLMEGGKSNTALQAEEGGLRGSLIDQFGICWEFLCPLKESI